MPERTHWVKVNEVHIMHRGLEIADWWVYYRMRATKAGRVRIIASYIIGDELLVRCESADDARGLAKLIQDRGVNKTSAKAVSFRASEEPPALTVEAVTA